MKLKYKPTMDWIVQDDNQLIRTVCTDLDVNNITSDDLENIQKMKDYIDVCYNQKYEEYDIKPGIAIASIQIGYTKKVSYINFDDEKNIHRNLLLINPEIIEKSYAKSYLAGGEGCLSVEKEHPGIVPRSSEITVRYYDLALKKYVTIQATGLFSICLQHEIDHLNGKLFYDRINPFKPDYIDPSWEEIN